LPLLKFQPSYYYGVVGHSFSDVTAGAL